VGDTVTLGLHKVVMQDKKEREDAAVKRIRKEFGDVLPWVPETIEAYESLATPEARFVKTIDKGLPSITHSLNGAVALREKGYTRESLQVVRDKERDESTHAYAIDQPEATTLRDALMDRVYASYE
jgi:putative hydrolases of HD superfamily